MKRLLGFSALALSTLLAVPAFAVQRTFVASFGLDANNCSITAPCRGLARALTQTDPGGEVIVLDSAGYGAFTITQSVSINAPEGVYAGISVFAGQDGITVNPGTDGKVFLRGISINGQGGNRGIVVQSGAEIHIERCVIANMGDAGLRIEGGTVVSVSRTVISSNLWGIDVPATAAPFAMVSDSRLSRNIIRGIRVRGGVLGLDRVVLENNGGGGVQAEAAAGNTVVLEMRNTTMFFNWGTAGVSLFATGAGSQLRARVDNSSSMHDARGFSTGAASLGVMTLTISRSQVSHSGEEGIFVTGTNATVHLRESTVTHSRTWGLRAESEAVINTCGNNWIAFNPTPPVGTASIGCNQ